MKTTSTLLAALATAVSLIAAPAVQAAGQENPFAALPYYGVDHVRDAGIAAKPAKAAEGVAGRKADSVKRVNPFAALPYYGADHQR